MPVAGPTRPKGDNPSWDILVLATALAVALCSARSTPGSWNDRSRLATVESLVDHHTLAIDQSIFAGTGDKLYIEGSFYSDKSPVPAVLMAGLYQVWQWLTGATARTNTGAFCWLMTFGTSGLAYVVAVWCVYRLGRLLKIPLTPRLVLTASFGLATVAPVYTRYTNNHILLLGVAAALVLGLPRLAAEAEAGQPRTARLLTLGGLAGFGYTIDLGAGPVLLACVAPLVAFRCRRLMPVLLFGLAALPWLALHHALNYAVGGTWKPANAVPEYFQWPGCPFNPQNLTGTWNHGSIGHFLTYAAALLGGKRGFLGHNLPLFLALPAIVSLLRRPTANLPEVLFAGCWCGGTWLIYALTSNNYSGQCCSIRWFVPLLAPAYYVLAVFLRRDPEYRGDLVILSTGGAVLAALMWGDGPWMKHMVPYYWPIQVGTSLSWIIYRVRRRRQRAEAASGPTRKPEPLPEAA